MLKRIFDFFLSLFGLILLSPLFLIIAILIKMDSRGPVFYLGQRVGKDGKKFKIIKFRTMVEGADKTGLLITPQDDQRLTRIGMTLRRFKLDELPQLINVLKGEMSLVGPRPESPIYADFMTEEEKKIVFSLKPGMTDWASLNYFRQEELLNQENAMEVFQKVIRPTKVSLQIKYVKERNFFIDLIIIFQTFKKWMKVIFREIFFTLKNRLKI
ncbi:MAG: sugar transferase [Minisyncoccales bacterium]